MEIDPCSREIVIGRYHHPRRPAPERRLCAPGAKRTILARGRQIVIAAREAARAARLWLAHLPFDSRDQLHSKEYHLARLGLSWVSDPEYDAALAHEIEAARLRRMTSDDALGNAAQAEPGPPRPSLRGTAASPYPGVGQTVPTWPYRPDPVIQSDLLPATRVVPFEMIVPTTAGSTRTKGDTMDASRRDERE